MRKPAEQKEKDLMHTILLLDDDITLLNHGRRILKDAGYHVIPARDAMEGLNILENRRDISLIVTDNKMPGLTGLEFAEILYSRDRGVPVIMVSSDLNERVVTMGQKVGIRGFLEKPYQGTHMQGIVKTVLESL